MHRLSLPVGVKRRKCGCSLGMAAPQVVSFDSGCWHTSECCSDMSELYTRLPLFPSIGFEPHISHEILNPATYMHRVLHLAFMAGRNPTDSILRTFRLEKTTIEGLQGFLERHPEVGSLNHLVQVALTEFISIHKKDKTWLRVETPVASP